VRSTILLVEEWLDELIFNTKQVLKFGDADKSHYIPIRKHFPEILLTSSSSNLPSKSTTQEDDDDLGGVTVTHTGASDVDIDGEGGDVVDLSGVMVSKKI
jgi:hypothetical protein